MLILLLALSPAHSAERREFSTGTRSLAMGGVSVATVNDETALIANPAALGRLRDFYGTIIDPELEVNNHIATIRKEQAISSSFSISKISDVALANEGKYLHSRLQYFPSFVGRNFGIGILGRSVLDMEAASATELETFYQDDLALILGYNLPLWGGRIKLGFSGKVISRHEVAAVIDPSTQALGPSDLAAADILREGVGVSTDVGILLTAPWTFLPTVGAVLRDVGGTTFDQMTGVRGLHSDERPTAVKQDLDVGISISPIHSQLLRSHWSIEYKGVLTASDEEDKAKLIHFGSEFNVGDLFFVRFGYHQRYLTAGLEFASERLQFQMSTHGEEIGTADAPREDRRMTLKMGVRF